MKLMVLGRYPAQETLTETLSELGMTAQGFYDPGEVYRVSGGPGAFRLETGQGEAFADYILLAGRRGDGEGLWDRAALARIGRDRPVSILLDEGEDSRPWVVGEALSLAARLAGERYRVTVFSRSVRTAADGLEERYAAARRLGVLFFRYDRLKAAAGADRAGLRADGPLGAIAMGSTSILRPQVQLGDAWGAIPGLFPGGRWDRAEEKFFMPPPLTPRRGVYRLTDEAALGEAGALAAQIGRMAEDIREVSRAVIARVDREKCAFCYTCYRVCPHGAMEPEPAFPAMRVVAGGCLGCGVCAALCPARAISMETPPPRAVSRGGPIKVFACENSGAAALPAAARVLAREGISLSWESAACGGGLSAGRLMEALKTYERVLVAVCMDDACRHLNGNCRAERFAERVSALLARAGMDAGRVSLVKLSWAMPGALAEAVRGLYRAAERGEAP